MKIVYLISTLGDKGPVNVLYNTLRYMNFKSNKVFIITLSPERTDSIIDKFKHLNIEIIQLNLSRFKGLFLTQKKINNILKKIKPDIIQANCFRSMLLIGYFIKKYKKITAIHNFPDDDFIMKHGYPLGKLMTILSRLGFKKSDFLIAVSQPLKKIIDKAYRLDLFAINNGLDIEKIQNYKLLNKSNIKKEFKINDNKTIFLYLDSIIDRKDPITTINAFINSFNDNKDVILLLAGNGYLLEDLQNKYKHHENVIFLGFIKEPYKLLQIADYYISTSLSESFHLSVIEAFIIDVPVILSDISVHRYLFNLHSSLGLLFKTGNENDLSEKMENILKMKFKKPLIPFDVLENNKLTAKKMSEEYQKFYQKVIHEQ